jgi:hypothetical protein
LRETEEIRIDSEFGTSWAIRTVIDHVSQTRGHVDVGEAVEFGPSPGVHPRVALDIGNVRCGRHSVEGSLVVGRLTPILDEGREAVSLEKASALEDCKLAVGHVAT